jgi:hypothetical protein
MECVGCLLGPPDLAFSPGWVQDQKHTREFQRRQAYVGKGEWVIAEDRKGEPTAAVRLDEKGRPKLEMGKMQGLHVDVDIDTKPGVKARYKWEW